MNLKTIASSLGGRLLGLILSIILVSGLLASPILAVDEVITNAAESTNAAKSTASPSKYATKSPEYWKKKAEQRAKKRVERQKRIDKIFEEAKGYEIKFDYEGHEKEREIAYEYYKRNWGMSSICDPEIEEMLKTRSVKEVFTTEKDNVKIYGCFKLDRDAIGIDTYDIDGDGIDEIFIFNKGSLVRHGYHFEILKLDKEKSTEEGPQYYPITNTICNSEKIKILETKTLDMPDILFEYAVSKWNGKGY